MSVKGKTRSEEVRSREKERGLRSREAPDVELAGTGSWRGKVKQTTRRDWTLSGGRAQSTGEFGVRGSLQWEEKPDWLERVRE